MKYLIFWLCAVYIAAFSYCLIMCIPRMRCWRTGFKRQQRLHNEQNARLAVLIPARNESMSVGALFDCLCEQTYPRDCFDVHVIVADYEDATIGMATDRGFEAHVVQNQTCKSDALDACWKKILADTPDRYDAYIIIDADCGLDSHFLEEMNNALASGADIICSKKLVKNYFYGTAKKCPMSASCNGLIWTMLDGLGNKYKSEHGYPCFTVGTGLMIRSHIISEMGGWPYRETLTEDAEFMHDSTLKHRKFFYYEHAVLYMEEAPNLKETNKRRRRWLTGVVECDRLYGERVRRSCTPEERYYTSALNHVYAYVGTTVIFGAVSAALALAVGMLGREEWTIFVLLSLIALAVLYVSFFVITAVAVACERKNIKMSFGRKVLLLFVHPLFYMQYISIIGKALMFPRKPHTWEVIERVDFSEGEGE